MVKKFLVLFLYLLSLSACITYGPEDSPAFAEVHDLHQLVGSYRNLGDPLADSRPVYLSGILWPGETSLEHKKIDRIDVQTAGDRTLSVKAFRGEHLEKEGTYVLGRNFDLREGKIILKRGPGVVGLKAGEPMLGLYHESVELGLDISGQGKYSQNVAAAGLGYLIVPIAIAGREDVRFERLK